MEFLRYDTQRVKDYMVENGLGPMDLVRLCGIAMMSAYRCYKAEPVKDLGVLYKVYVGLKAAGHPVTFESLTGIV